MNNISDLTERIKKQNQSLRQNIERLVASENQELMKCINENLQNAQNTTIASMQDYQNKLLQQIATDQEQTTLKTVEQIFTQVVSRLTDERIENFKDAMTSLVAESEQTLQAVKSTQLQMNTQLQQVQQTITEEIKTAHSTASAKIQSNISELDQQAKDIYSEFIASLSSQTQQAEQILNRLQQAQNKIQEQTESINLSSAFIDTQKAMIFGFCTVVTLLVLTLIFTAIEPMRTAAISILMITIALAIAVAITFIAYKKISEY